MRAPFSKDRLSEDQLKRYRQEVSGGGLSSYPHPWLMPDFWQTPTGSMGIGPITAIYQARFLRYLQHRGLANTETRHVWGVFGDGEMDEPESIAGLSLAAREGLDNLTFVINCNLQRLDGPVRGNGQIIPELESLFRGAAGTSSRSCGARNGTLCSRATRSMRCFAGSPPPSMASIRRWARETAATISFTSLTKTRKCMRSSRICRMATSTR